MKWKTIACAVFNLLLDIMASGHTLDEDFRARVTKCCRPQDDSNVYQQVRGQNCYNTTWDLKNATNGRFTMRFNFPKRDKPYDTKLYVNDNITSREECEMNKRFDTSSWPRHTIGKTQHVYDWSNENCNENNTCYKTGGFNFQFIFKGCYQLDITPNGDPMRIQICPVFLDSGSSGYEKMLLTDNYTVDTSKTHPEFPAILQLNTDYYPWEQIWLIESNVGFTFKRMPNGTKTREIIAKWEVNLKPDKQVSCYSEPQYQPQVECEVLQNSGILEIRLAGIEPGDYQYWVSLSPGEDVRCQSPTLWTKDGCRWVIDQTVVLPRNDTDIEIKTKHPYIIYVPILAGVFVILIFTFVGTIYATKKRRLRVPVQAPMTAPVIEQRPAILLLYSRDCDAFMKLTESFRQLLEQVTEFEIYDCYDPNRWPQVNRDPSAWMRRLATSRDVRVILVASQCAILRQRAHLVGCTVQFAEPLNMDKLFEYGLQLLTDVAAHNATYQSTFVVRFDGFSDDDDLFQALNSYTRFVLPLHLDKLLSSLNQNTTDQVDESWLTSEKGRILCENLNNLVRFKQENPDYLQNLLKPVDPLAVNA